MSTTSNNKSAKSKQAEEGSTSREEHSIGEELTTNASRVRFVSVSEDGGVLPSESETVVVRIFSTIVDRLDGTVVTEGVWREKVNMDAVMKRAQDPGVREICAKFFLKRSVSDIIAKLIPTRTIKAGEAAILPSELFEGIAKAIPDVNAQFVIMEVVNSYLQKVGLVTKHGKFTMRVYNHFTPVTTTMLAGDIAMQEVVRAMDSVKLVDVGAKKYTPNTFAEEIAEALYPVGKALLEVNELGGIIDDMVRGVRAYIDPIHDGLPGHVESSWSNNPVIVELASNFVFVDAAVKLPVGSSISPSNDGWNLSKWAPIVLASLKMSKRYAIVGKNEVTRTLGLKKVRNLLGVPVSYILWRNAKPEAVAQTIFAFQDAKVVDAVTVTPTKERVAEAIVAAYGDTSNLGTAFAVEALFRFLSYAAESGWEDTSALGIHVDLGEAAGATHTEVACMIAESVRFVLNPKDDNSPRYHFRVETKEREFKYTISGRLDRGTLLTSEIGEVFIAADEFEPQGALDARPQLLAPISFDSRMLGFDMEGLAALNRRYSFDIKFGSSEVRGSFKSSDLGSMRSNSLTSVVTPSYNEDVFKTVGSVFEAIGDRVVRMAKLAGKEGGLPGEVIGWLARQHGRSLLKYSQSLSAGFRQEVHSGMAQRAVVGMTTDQALSLHSRLMQNEFGGFADVSALLIFLMMQGIEIESFTEALADVDMIRVFLDYGTDRNKAN